MEMTKLEKDFLEALRIRDIDLNGRRIINAGSAVEDNDLMSKAAVMDLLRELGLVD